MKAVDRWLGIRTNEFSFDGTKYDQTYFSGRWRHMVDLINPFTLLTSDKDLNHAVELLDAYKAGQLPEGTTDDELWEAKRLKSTILHPDTGLKLPHPFRFSAFIPCNMPILAGMMFSTKTTASICFWQMINQTWNVGFNYCNRNASSNYTVAEMMTGYVAAMGGAIAVGLLADKFIVAYLGTGLLARSLGPPTAMAIAGNLNLVIIRRKELYEGVNVYNKDGELVGNSKVAAKDGLLKTCGLRALYQYPGCYLAVLGKMMVQGLNLYPAGRVAAGMTDLGVFAFTMAINMPICMAAFPQIVSAEKLEPELDGSKGFYYNRGL